MDPKKTWSPWNPVDKKIDPKLENIEKEIILYSKHWKYKST